MEKPVTLKLPEVLAGQLVVNIHTHLEVPIRFIQNKPYWDEKQRKWVINIILLPIDYHLKMRPGA